MFEKTNVDLHHHAKEKWKIKQNQLVIYQKIQSGNEKRRDETIYKILWEVFMLNLKFRWIVEFEILY